MNHYDNYLLQMSFVIKFSSEHMQTQRQTNTADYMHYPDHKVVCKKTYLTWLVYQWTRTHGI